RDGVDEMQLLAAAPHGGDEVGRLQDADVLGGGLPGHVEVGRELAQRLPVPLAQEIQQLPAARGAERLEHLVSTHRPHLGIRCRYLPACQWRRHRTWAKAGVLAPYRRPLATRCAAWR